MLEVEDSGEAFLRRVVALNRAGSFASELSDVELEALRKAVKAVGNSTVTIDAPGRPPYEIEELSSDAASLKFHPAQKLPKAVRTLRDQMLEVAEGVIEHPIAGMELSVAAESGTVSVQAIGSEAVEANWDSAAVTFDLFGKDEALLTSGTVALETPSGIEVHAPGWRCLGKLVIDFHPDQTLQVRLRLGLKYADGAWRQAEITAVEGKGWS